MYKTVKNRNGKICSGHPVYRAAECVVGAVRGGEENSEKEKSSWQREIVKRSFSSLVF